MRLKLIKEELMNDHELLFEALKSKVFTSLVSEDEIELLEVRPFPIYMHKLTPQKRDEYFKEAFRTLQEDYIHLNRDIILEHRFWVSLYFFEFRDYLIKMYPRVIKSLGEFKNIITKKFDWENYIYKSILVVEYLNDYRDQTQHEHYYDLILNNFDLFNYTIKYNLTRNARFLLTILDIIDKNNLTDEMKKAIRHRNDLGRDERYGRRVIYEFNKNYPVMMFPEMSEETIEEYFLKFYELYLEN